MNKSSSHLLDNPAMQANKNMFSAALIVETLHRCGLTRVVICPGSRSATLAIAFGLHPEIEAIPVLDERSAAFFALGLAKQERKPVALICSSGTAAANFYPAVVEASMSKLPLIILTADRPHDLRDCHSPQTIDQVKLYGHYPRFQHEIRLPEASIDYFSYLKQTIAHSIERAQFPDAGPVHLNCPFEAPLHPEPVSSFQSFIQGIKLDLLVRHLTPFEAPEITLSPSNTQHFLNTITRSEAPARGLIIVGHYEPVNAADAESFAVQVNKLSQALHCPVLADAHNPLRHFTKVVTNLVCNYEPILQNEAISQQLLPDFILFVGLIPTSKALRKWLKTLQIPTFFIEPSSDNIDDLHQSSHFIRSTLQTFTKELTKQSLPALDGTYLNDWLKLEDKARKELEFAIGNCTHLFEGRIPFELSTELKEQHIIFMGISTPRRDFELFYQPNNKQHLIYFNRGAIGLDGNLSTALGVAHKRNLPAIAVVGDLGFLHDSNALLLAQEFKGTLTIIVVNNNGGRIFQTLPVAHFEVPIEKLFYTPQMVSIEKLCEAHKISYLKPQSWDDFTTILNAAHNTGIRVLEVCTDADLDIPIRKKILNSISNKLPNPFLSKINKPISQ